MGFLHHHSAKLALLALIDQNTQGEIFDSEMDPSDQGGEVSIWLLAHNFDPKKKVQKNKQTNIKILSETEVAPHYTLL